MCCLLKNQLELDILSEIVDMVLLFVENSFYSIYAQPDILSKEMWIKFRFEWWF